MVLSKSNMTMASVTTALLLASSSLATPSTAAAVGEGIESHKIQLRGASRSLGMEAPDRFTEDRKRAPLPVSPGIAEGVDDLPCLVETICSEPRLSILCGFITSNLGEWNSTSGEDNFFLGEGEGTFLAPVDGAFVDYGTLLSRILTEDLADPAIVEDVLAYHTIPINETANITDIFLSVEDFECHEPLLMGNGETSTTYCFDDLTKHQLGPGNMNLRTAPAIIEAGIEACDGAVVLHFVDQLIVPPLPLAEEPPPSEEAPSSGETTVCPINVPVLGSSCRDTRGSCGYQYHYDGCSWTDLQCVPQLLCSCSDVGEDGTGIWTCTVDLSNRLNPCPEPEPVATARAEIVERPQATPIWIVERPQAPIVGSNGLPVGRCDPNEALPTPFDDIDECPAMRSSESCREYPAGKMCEFGHMYQGCSWRDLECVVVEKCECGADGSWMCMARAAQMCGTFDVELGWVEDELPDGLPWGDACDPDEELPRPPSDDSIESRLSEECPPTHEFGSCEGFQRNLTCAYNYEYDGCTWDTLECSPIVECECNGLQDGDWTCRTEARLSCTDRRPEGFPRGKCDPTERLPLPPTNTTAVTAVASSSTTSEVVVSLLAGGMP